MPETPETRRRRGIVYGLTAYALWGLVPLFWPLVARAGAFELLAHRVIWSLLIAIGLLLTVVEKGWWQRIRSPRNLLLLALAATVVSVNWGVYIWAVNHGHVVETSLGYYINPIFSILLGVLLLRERLAPLQWACVGLAGAAVVVLTIDYGRPPWIALALAVSFGVYGLIKNRLNVGAVESLTVETAFLTPIALGYLLLLQAQGTLTFGHLGWRHTVLLMATGVVTLIPLLCFAVAAPRLPLSTLGLLQYLAPTLQFLLGVLYFGEAMSPARWAGFALVWLALMVLSAAGLHQASRGRPTELVA
jgi:chloramphenicol-sensitive protein RarD